MQKFARMKTVIDAFAVRVFDSKNKAYTNILEEVSGLHSPLRSIIAGAPLLRVQVNTNLLTDIALTMMICRSILLQYYGLTEEKHSHVFKDLENRHCIMLEFFLAPMQAVTPQYVHHNVYSRLSRQELISNILTIFQQRRRSRTLTESSSSTIR